MYTCNVANLVRKLNYKDHIGIDEFKNRSLLKHGRQDTNVYVTKAIEIDYIIPPAEVKDKIY
jgi:hypothetical protein